MIDFNQAGSQPWQSQTPIICDCCNELVPCEKLMGDMWICQSCWYTFEQSWNETKQ
jgi:hypothetical protein